MRECVLNNFIVGYHCSDVGIVKRPNVSISEEFASGQKLVPVLPVSLSHQQSRVESSRVQSESRVTGGAHRLESNKVRASSSGFLVLFE